MNSSDEFLIHTNYLNGIRVRCVISIRSTIAENVRKPYHRKTIQMKAKFTFYFYVALLPSIIHGCKSVLAYSLEVSNIAKKGDLINDIFQPTRYKHSGTIGTFGFTFRGIFVLIRKEVAMKFTPFEYRSDAEKEYVMYSYLHAIGNASVEQYGIPSVYYYGTWDENKLIMMGISLLDQSIQDLEKSQQLCKNDVNVLIILRDFILSSKYMHSRGVRHNDIKLTNMMVRNHRSFLIDFNLSSKMNEITKTGSLFFAPRRAHTGEESRPKDDWEGFLYSICYSLGASFEWIEGDLTHDIPTLKANTTDTIRKIEEGIDSKILRKVMVQFGEHVLFDDGVKVGSSRSASKSKRFPDYDRFYKLVNDEIKQLKLPPPVVFTWLTKSQREQAAKDLEEHPIPIITEIKDPKTINFSTMKYPNVDLTKFALVYKNRNIASASSSPSERNSASSDTLKRKR